MKLHRLCDVTPDGRGTLYRQGRLQGAISTLVFTLVFGGAPILWYRVGAPWFVWALCAVLGIFIVPMVIGDYLMKLRETNWIVWLRPDGLWINFRSYQDRGSCDSETVLQLEFAEIAEVRQAGEIYFTPGSEGGSVRQSIKSLEIMLAHDRTDEFAAALACDRTRPPPRRQICGVGVTTRPAHFPVSLPEPDRIRLAWRGGTGNWVAPSLGHVLAELAGLVRTTAPSQVLRGDWRELTESELDDQIVRLVQAGDKLSAVDLLRKRRGYSTTDAHRFVEELLAPAGTT